MGNVELLKCMIDHGIDKDTADLNGVSLLRHVVTSDNVEAVRYLLDLGVVIPNDTRKVCERQCKRCMKKALIVDENQLSRPVHESNLLQ